MIKNFEPRLYQQTIFATAARKNTLVVLPTGMGKTNIAVMLAQHRLNQYPSSKILVLAPTKPLVEQIASVFKEHTDIQNIAVFTGFVKPEIREQLWKTSTIIVSTPQGLENDIISGKIKLEDVSLLTFDECHRAVGDYSYVWLAKQYTKTAKYERILALTASPGSEIEKINEIIENLFIEEIEIRTDTDPDVRPYIKEIDIKWIPIILPDEFKEIQKYLKNCYKSKLNDIANNGYLDKSQISNENKTEILKLQAHLQGEIASGNKDFTILKSLSLAAEAMKVQHAIELVETQGITALHKYLEQLQMQSQTTKTKAVQNLVRDLNFRSAYIKTLALVEKNIEHPKLAKLKEIINERKNEKIIVFTQYRDSGEKITQELTKLGIKAELFVGQAKKGSTGLSQKKQIEMLGRFSNNEFNVLVSSSVGEEGLDIPVVDLVIFYEPIPSAIRHIQRRGRTGRSEKGEVIILMAKDTRDEGYRWSAFHKEKRMYKTLDMLRSKLILKPRETPLTNYAAKEEIRIYADYREKASGVIKELMEKGVNLALEQFQSGDYLLSPEVAIEYKTQEDFIDSLIDGRLFKQAAELKETYAKPIILVEGSMDLFSIRNLHPNSVRGMLAALAVSFNIPILYTKNPKDSAEMLYAIARREQIEEGKKDFSLHGSRKPSTIKQQQEYLVSAIPTIGPALAKPLLTNFKTIKNIANASEDELKQIELIGDKKAKKIREVFDSEYSNT